jgi:sugar lactone lactonase YvrE
MRSVFGSLLAAGLAAVIATLAAAPAQRGEVPVSDAERRYVAPQATTRVAEAPRTATLAGDWSRKFSPENSKANVTIANPYLDPARPLFAKAEHIECTPDGGLVVAGRAGFDADDRALGVGYWRIARDGAVTPFHTRSTGAYALTSRTTCEAPFGKSRVGAGKFSMAADGRVLFSATATVQAITTAGQVTRLAGSPRDCENDNTAGITGFEDGARDAARFREPDRPVEDGDGNIWVADQQGCALRRIAPDGAVTTVIPASTLCDEAVSLEERPLLDNLTWDPVHRELVAGGARTVARPVHNLYTTIWRITPSGEYRRVLFSTKLGRSPARANLDGIRALALDPQGRIHVVSLLMLFERRGWDALQLMRVDEAAGTVVPLTGTKIPNGTFLADHPKDGPAGQAVLERTRTLCVSPDGTAYVNDDQLIRRIDTAGQVTTWAF